ncbi:chloride channel protein [Sphingomonas sp. QA11]|uniref:chloride channel protein n=1 Tax=Sphingomonas sp. QA11 TaxID=2950605 RepID=UPI00234AD2F8|nr:chloride channel protein [Sphingomonas sp. QA11]WCM25213.1 chloride channel protein [Sphingomonas sp. QA11]
MSLHPRLIALTWFARLRRRFRSSEAWFIVLAIAAGGAAGLLTVILGGIARTLQHLLFRLPTMTSLSSLTSLSPLQLLMLPLGGLVLAGFTWLTRARKRAMVDAVEANALHGGHMSMADSLVISGQTVISNGFGASVGLEAGYAQLGGAVGSVAGGALRLRRADLRTLVGAGAGAGIAAAFGAPLAGAFYAFEIVIGAYTPSAIAPVAAAALAGASLSQAVGIAPYIVSTTTHVSVPTVDYLLYALLGALCAVLGIGLMRAVALVEAGTRALRLPGHIRPAIGGALLIPIAMVSPQVLSSGHGALHLDLAIGFPLSLIALVLAAKCLASIVSLGFGFRGGLFFASLFIGTLVGHLFAGLLGQVAGHPLLVQDDAAVVGMAALAVAVVGGPMTVAMLVLEATHDFFLTGAVVAASLVASTIVRARFGYSFSTWRLHLRGETIKSARDVGWVRTLTAGRMMRRETQATPADISVAEFRRRFPLGSASRAVLVGPDGGYAGIVVPAIAYADGVDERAPVASLVPVPSAPLAPDADIVAIMARFDADQVDELAVTGPDGAVLGVLSEKFVRRRYAEELEKGQRDLFGE